MGIDFRRWKQRGVVALVVVAGFLLGLFLYARLGEASVTAPKAASLQGVPVQRTTVTASLTATGQVQASRQVALTFLMSGQVREVLVKEGDQVKAGQPLARLDSADLELKVSQAQVQLAFQEAKLAELLAGATATDIAAARQGATSAQASLTKARNDLAKLKDGPTAAEIAAARQGVTSAQANLTKATNALRELKDGPTAAEVAAARQGMASAQASLTKARNDLQELLDPPTAAKAADAQRAVVAAQSSLASAISNLNKVLGLEGHREAADLIVKALGEIQTAVLECSRKSPPQPPTSCPEYAAALVSFERALGGVSRSRSRGATDDDIAVAEAQVVSAEAGLAKALADLADLLDGPSDRELRNAEGAVASAEAALTSAQTKLADLLDGPSAQELSDAEGAVVSAEAALAAAQAKLEDVLQAPLAQDISNAEATVRSAEAALAAAQAKLADTVDGPTPVEIQSQQVQVALAQVALQQAQRELEKATLVAPFDSTITALTLQVGQQISSSTAAATIFSPLALEVKINVGENDVARLRVGQQVTVNTEASAGRGLTGRVASISAAGLVEQGVVNFPVVVALEGLSPQASQRPRPGMTATLAVITAQQQNVLAVPSRALRREGRRQFVEVVADGKRQTRNVTVGLQGDQMVEIREGLAEGEVVVLPLARARAATSSPQRTYIPGVGPVGGRGGGGLLGGPAPTRGRR